MFLRRDALKRTILPDVAIGAEVITADGARLGKVSDVGDVSFKIDAPMASDYWLGRDYVIDATDDGVYMSFEKAELNGYKLGQPGLSPEKDTTQESLIDGAVPEEQQIEQRLRMEQQLAEQRRNLPHTHPDGTEDTAPDTGGTIGMPVEDELRQAGIDPLPEEPAESERGVDVEELLDEPVVEPAAWSATTTSSDGFGAERDTPAIEYSVPTQRSAADPARMRTPLVGGATVVAVMGAIAALAAFVFLRRRRKQRFDDRLRRLAQDVVGAGKDRVEEARGVLDSVRR